jgi:hypothetical protein
MLEQEMDAATSGAMRPSRQKISFVLGKPAATVTVHVYVENVEARGFAGRNTNKRTWECSPQRFDKRRITTGVLESVWCGWTLISATWETWQPALHENKCLVQRFSRGAC